MIRAIYFDPDDNDNLATLDGYLDDGYTVVAQVAPHLILYKTDTPPASEPVADDSIPQGDRLNREYTLPEFLREFFPNIDPDEIDRVTEGTSSNTLTYAQLESALSNQGIKYRKLAAERNEDFRVLQADMRRMADENQRLRAFVQKVVDTPLYAATNVEDEALLWRAKGRALLDAETD